MGGPLPHHRPQQPPALTDFPPLSSESEKKAPVAGGAWQNSSNMRSALKAGPAPAPAAQASPGANPCRLEDSDRAFERPPPKGNAELFNPKAGRPHGGANGNGAAETYGEQEAAPDALVERVEGLSLAAPDAEVPLAVSPAPGTPPGEP